MSNDAPVKFWSVGEDIQTSPLPQASLWNSELWTTVEEEIDALDASLRELSLDIHGRLLCPYDSSDIEPISSPPRATIRRKVRCSSVSSVQVIRSTTHPPTQDTRTMS